MALSDPKDFSFAKTDAQLVTPISLTSGWVQAITAGGPATADESRIVNPDGSIDIASRRILKRGGRGGTYLAVRLGYDDGLTSITNPKVAVFGRTGTEAWQRLLSRASADSATLTTSASNDSTDGTLKYTNVDPSNHVFDMMGCDILIGVETALNGSTTVLTNSIIEVKVF